MCRSRGIAATNTKLQQARWTVWLNVVTSRVPYVLLCIILVGLSVSHWRHSWDYVGRHEERERVAKECCCPQGKQDLTYVEAHSSFGGVEGGEWSRETPRSCGGEGCDHSVIEHYCHNRYTRTHGEVHTWANVYKYIEVEMLMCDFLWQPSCMQTHTSAHTPVHQWRQPPQVKSCGDCHFLHQHLSPGSCTRNETSASTSAFLHAVLSHPLFFFFFHPLSFFIPRCVKPASYDNSASKDVLTLLGESTGALQFPS